jgi:hypothetical protein
MYGTNLLELTYQHKMHETSVTRINKIFNTVLDSFVSISKVFSVIN